MRTALLACFVLVPALAYGDPRTICLESTIRDGGGKTLSSPTVLAVDGEPASVKLSGPDSTLVLGLTARVHGDRVALDIEYDEKTRGVGTWTTRSFATHAVVNDREQITLSLPGRELVITPKIQTLARR